MRFLRRSLPVLGLAIGLATITKQVLALDEVCYPSCSTYTADFSGSAVDGTHPNNILAIDEKTPWAGQIYVNKFNPALGDLKSVTIKAKLQFDSQMWATRPTGTSFTGNVAPTMMLHMDLAGSDAGKLADYWGRWGNYAELDDNTGNDEYTNQGQNGKDVTGLDLEGDLTGAPDLFIPYTYPLFDIIGAKNQDGDNLPLRPPDSLPGTDPLHTGATWAYYAPYPNDDFGTKGWAQYTYGSIGHGIWVERVDDFHQLDFPAPKSEYFTLNTAATSLENYVKYAYDSSTMTEEQEIELGSTSLNRFTDELALSKTIHIDDINGGVLRSRTPESMLALFTGTGQVEFDAKATGYYINTWTGGNAAFRQTSHAKVAVQVRYQYAAAEVQGDPQFNGFQGQSFQVHGYPGSYFNLFSAPSFQMNGRFSYLATGHCKYSHTPCWSHPGTYIDDLAFVVDELLVRVTAGPVGSGYSVLINEEPFHGHNHVNDTDAAHTDERAFVPTKFHDPNTLLTVHLKSPLELSVRTELAAFNIHNADHFFNIDSQLLVRPIMKMGRKPSAQYPDPYTGKAGFPNYPIHGFIGQTWANKKYTHNKLYQGEVDDYLETRPYATESLFSQYHKQFQNNQTQWE